MDLRCKRKFFSEAEAVGGGKLGKSTGEQYTQWKPMQSTTKSRMPQWDTTSTVSVPFPTLFRNYIAVIRNFIETVRKLHSVGLVRSRLRTSGKWLILNEHICAPVLLRVLIISALLCNLRAVVFLPVIIKGRHVPIDLRFFLTQIRKSSKQFLINKENSLGSLVRILWRFACIILWKYSDYMPVI